MKRQAAARREVATRQLQPWPVETILACCGIGALNESAYTSSEVSEFKKLRFVQTGWNVRTVLRDKSRVPGAQRNAGLQAAGTHEVRRHAVCSSASILVLLR